jgi:hypothetical protein
VFLRLGGAEVVASAADHFFPFGTYYDLAIGDGKREQDTHLAVVRADADCLLYVSEKR